MGVAGSGTKEEELDPWKVEMCRIEAEQLEIYAAEAGIVAAMSIFSAQAWFCFHFGIFCKNKPQHKTYHLLFTISFF